MTPEQIARWRTKHPGFWATYLDDLLWNIRLCHSTPSLTLLEMVAYIADLDSLRQMVPLALATLDEANLRTIEEIEGCPFYLQALVNAGRLLRQARDLGWTV